MFHFHKPINSRIETAKKLFHEVSHSEAGQKFTFYVSGYH